MHENLSRAVDLVVNCFENGGKLLICGNGGSGADSAHILGELVKGFMMKRPLPAELIEKIGEPWARDLQMGLPAIDLTSNNALIGAVANDQGGLLPYAQQVMAYARPHDVLLGISTSGNAENVIRAMKTAKALGASTIALTGEDGGKMGFVCDVLLNVDERETYKVQEKHLPLYHALCTQVEARLFS
ncbi:MAG: SIS domain-containing protein [Clostridia bacterium]